MDNWEIVEKVSSALLISEKDIVSKSRRTDVIDAKTIIAHKIHTINKTKLHLIYDVIYHEQTRKPETRHCNVTNLLKRYKKLSEYNKPFQIKVEACRLIQ